MKQKKACGWILVSPNNTALVVRNRRRGDWGVPKGHVENGESENQTALRELHEETGLTKERFIPRDGWRRSLVYHINPGSQHEAEKTTVLFVGDCPTIPNIVLSDEHDDYQWASNNDVSDLVDHKDLRAVILEVLESPV